MVVDIRGRKMKKPPACVQCRKRKIGCDRAKPSCGNCLRNGKTDCFYPDVPGIYVQSNTSSISQSGSQGTIGIGSLEQMRELNTRMQLMSSTVASATVPSSALRASSMSPSREAPQFIPRVSAAPVNVMGNGEEQGVNLVRGPAIFDTAKVPYTQDEVLAKELEFLRDRLLDLERVTGRNVLQLTVSTATQNPGAISGGHSNLAAASATAAASAAPSAARTSPMSKKRKTGDGAGGDDYDDDYDDDDGITFDEFKSVDPAFLDPYQVLRVVVTRSQFYTPQVPLPASENRLFEVGHLAMRDDFLCWFHNRLYDVMANKLPERLSHQQHAHIGRGLNNNGNNVSNNNSGLCFPPKQLCTHWITYFTTHTDISTLVPMLQPQELTQTVDQWFPLRDVMFSVNAMSVDQMAMLGQITLYLLFCYQSLTSTVLVPLKDEQLHRFEELRDYVPQLHSNLTTIMTMVSLTGTATLSRKWKLRLLPFVASLKLYESMSGWSSVSQAVDCDEDLHWALDLGINHETQDQQLIILWNFVNRNCCWRKLVHGELPLALLSGLSSSTRILDSVLLQDHDFLRSVTTLLKYLHNRDETLNVARLGQLKAACKETLLCASHRCFNTQLMISHVADTLLSRNVELFVNVYALLHYESLGAAQQFNNVFREFIQFLQETAFYVFSGLANLKFAGYEFVFARPAFTILKNIILILFSLSERARIGSSQRPELHQLKETLISFIRKLCMLLSDYSKNCKSENPVVSEIKTIVTTILEANANSFPTVISTPLNNGFLSLDAVQVSKNIAKLRTTSDTLIKTDFYEKRGPFVPKSPSTYGIVVENFSSVYKAFFQ
ncbi:HBR320Cp [Eremothecium sinecaudum]|uniref:HBR320Cp n=1 Tax=Eremothecium sinecaudum TaxID=45286 RepID=A0A125RE25_9SACH|nr:HBR320Cp [Eremothecium sinecaudum]AMD19221.1 HBR320Cp [Eremothecium sinecaudum]